jgi:hypothetical protein
MAYPSPAALPILVNSDQIKLLFDPFAVTLQLPVAKQTVPKYFALKAGFHSFFCFLLSVSGGISQTLLGKCFPALAASAALAAV